MISLINTISEIWAEYIFYASWQNSVYLILIFMLIFIFRWNDIKAVRVLLLLGLIKMLIPPFISSPSDVNLIPISFSTPVVSVLKAESSLINYPEISNNSILMFIWLISMVIFMVIVGLNVFRVRNIAKKATKIEIQQLISIKTKFKIIVLKSKQIHSPFISGIFKYKIIVPLDWDNWSMSYKRTVLIHELNHIKNMVISDVKLIEKTKK